MLGGDGVDLAGGIAWRAVVLWQEDLCCLGVAIAASSRP
ncbi:hypothetical protein XOC_1416 [Xanthomonas oryzae pv. oryzicola BLS256]|uniref:Uncharacterized protein n=1 Tax=Xanthomonas oryzae pv. oryzicola (strain BLS256) TaxID=383407 RepID=G7TI78_XANOB|nr:hypothetical protein XOC_1416 [Xanthomonas oryzae pv. oryzicola BLS256]QEO98509.1 hypothetical protein XOCgx_3520 [Xanthomonas oryzae pv. oryzicola]